MNETRVSIESEHATSNGVGERNKLIGSESTLRDALIVSENKEPVDDILHEYTEEFKNALEDNEEKGVSILFDVDDWKSHLKGFRLRTRKGDSSKLFMLSTPLLDIIQLFPRVAEKLFYKMITVQKSSIRPGSIPARRSSCKSDKEGISTTLGKSYI